MVAAALRLYTMVIADCNGADVLLQEYGPEYRADVFVCRIPQGAWDDRLLCATTPSAIVDNCVVHLMLLAEGDLSRMRAFAEAIGTELRRRVIPTPITRYVLRTRGPLLCVEAC